MFQRHTPLNKNSDINRDIGPVSSTHPGSTDFKLYRPCNGTGNGATVTGKGSECQRGTHRERRGVAGRTSRCGSAVAGCSKIADAYRTATRSSNCRGGCVSVCLKSDGRAEDPFKRTGGNLGRARRTGNVSG